MENKNKTYIPFYPSPARNMSDGMKIKRGQVYVFLVTSKIDVDIFQESWNRSAVAYDRQTEILSEDDIHLFRSHIYWDSIYTIFIFTKESHLEGITYPKAKHFNPYYDYNRHLVLYITISKQVLNARKFSIGPKTVKTAMHDDLIDFFDLKSLALATR